MTEFLPSIQPIEKTALLADIKAAGLGSDIQEIIANWLADQPGDTVESSAVAIFLRQLAEVEKNAATTLADAGQELTYAAEDEEAVDGRETVRTLEIMRGALREAEGQVDSTEKIVANASSQLQGTTT